MALGALACLIRWCWVKNWTRWHQSSFPNSTDSVIPSLPPKLSPRDSRAQPEVDPRFVPHLLALPRGPSASGAAWPTPGHGGPRRGFVPKLLGSVRAREALRAPRRSSRPCPRLRRPAGPRPLSPKAQCPRRHGGVPLPSDLTLGLPELDANLRPPKGSPALSRAAGGSGTLAILSRVMAAVALCGRGL